MSMSELEKLCTCEFGFRLGDGRTDTNRCMVHAMCREELLMVIAHDQEEDAASQQTVTTLQARVEALWLAGHNFLGCVHHARECAGWKGQACDCGLSASLAMFIAALAAAGEKP